MAVKTEYPDRGRAVRIHPKDKVHNQIEKIQAFIHWRDGEPKSKENVILELIDLGVTVIERDMKKYVQK